MISYETFCLNCRDVEERIRQTCVHFGRSYAEVALLPVTKTHPKEAVEYAKRYGFKAVGENRIQEAEDKQMACKDIAIEWEIIGHLQSNKAKRAAESFHRIQSVDTDKLAGKLARGAEEVGRVLPILLQVNAGNDPAKFGTDADAVAALLESVLKMPSLRVDGLMTIAPLDEDMEVARRCFMRLREVRDQLAHSFAVPLKELSMGMSGDLEPAIEAGSTMIRVGTALFGLRS